MRLKNAKEEYGISSTYYYKLKAKANGDDSKFIELLEEYKSRKTDRINKSDKPTVDSEN